MGKSSAQEKISGQKIDPIQDRLPLLWVRQALLLKKALVLANREFGVVNGKQAHVLLSVLDTLIEDKDLHLFFPVSIWQSGGGDESQRLIEDLLLERLKEQDVSFSHQQLRASQGAAEVFSTSMHMTIALQVVHRLMPAIQKVRNALGRLENRYALKVRVGRMHLQDSLPVTYGQLFSAHQVVLSDGMGHIHQALDGLFELAIGGGVIGSGYGVPEGLDQHVTDQLSQWLNLPFLPAKNKCALLSAHSGMLHMMGCLVHLACGLQKVVNDIRLLGSSAFGELLLPESSSAQVPDTGSLDALSMVCMQVIGAHQSVVVACTHGQLELNAYQPMILHNVLNSVERLADAMLGAERDCLQKLLVNESRTLHNLAYSSLWIEHLAEEVGFEKASEVAEVAKNDGLSIREACIRLKVLPIERLDTFFNTERFLMPEEA